MIRPIPTRPSWHRRLADAVHEFRRERAARRALRALDPRTLADIGVDASEISSIEAEAHAHAPLTRLRIVGATAHG